MRAIWLVALPRPHALRRNLPAPTEAPLLRPKRAPRTGLSRPCFQESRRRVAERFDEVLPQARRAFGRRSCRLEFRAHLFDATRIGIELGIGIGGLELVAAPLEPIDLRLALRELVLERRTLVLRQHDERAVDVVDRRTIG